MYESQVDDLKSAERDRLKFPEWQVPLQGLILESDRSKLSEKMQQVEVLILDRLQHLHEGSNGDAEREALNGARSTLRIIQREKLEFPEWK